MFTRARGKDGIKGEPLTVMLRQKSPIPLDTGALQEERQVLSSSSLHLSQLDAVRTWVGTARHLPGLTSLDTAYSWHLTHLLMEYLPQGRTQDTESTIF